MTSSKRPRRVAIGRREELVVEAEAVEEMAKHRIIVMREALVLAERVGDLRQRLAEMPGQHRLVGDVVGDLAESVHVVAERDQPRRIAGQLLIGMADEARARDLVEGADVRQARGPVTGLEDHRRASRLPVGPALQQLARFLVRPGPGGHRGISKRFGVQHETGV